MNNKVIIDEREVGKTTYLFNEIERLKNENQNIVVLDSATDHPTKSLLKKVISNYQNSIAIEFNKKENIFLNENNYQEYINNFDKIFPYNEIANNKEKIICFDLSYFLEMGHDVYDESNDINLYNYYRKLYNYSALQVAFSLILMEKYDIIIIEIYIINYRNK